MATTTTIASRYELLQQIGQGGMSDVWEAHDLTLDRRVALKRLRADDPVLTARLQQEAQALARLDHPGLVRLLDTGVDGGRPFVVMELVRGPTVAAALRSTKPAEASVAALGSQVAAALAYVHRAGIVHRDVKPSNILLDGDAGGAARLADFGIAQLGDGAALTATGTTVGTVGYMAPEQLEGARVGPPADVWALGMVLLECLTGARVYEGTPAEVVARRLAGPVPVPDAVPPGWRQLLGRLLDHDPDQRMVAAELSAQLAGGPPAATSATRAMPTAVPGVDHAAQTQVVALGAAERTAVLPHGIAAAAGRPPLAALPPRRRGRRGPLVVAAIAGAGLLLALWLATSGHGASRARAAGTTTTSKPPASSSTTSTTTAPTTTVPSLTSALDRLAGDLSAAVAGGSLSRDAAASVLSHAQAATTAGGQQAATDQIRAAATQLATATAAGGSGSATATQLSGDLAAVATALGVPSSAATATTAAPAPPPAPGKHGGGKGGDGGGG